jgi:CRISPR system Cascade subunit CasD
MRDEGRQRVSQGSTYLAFRLEGPLQSWGERARWTIRDTANEPTKSGVIGLLAACLGWGVEDDARIAELAAAVGLGVRTDRPGRGLVDFHTVVGGVMSAAGKIKRNQATKEPEVVVSRRSYLADASFLVVLSATTDHIDHLEKAMLDPVWPPFLGRKSCPPSIPIIPKRIEARGIEDALRQIAWTPRGAENPPDRLRAVVEVDQATPMADPGLLHRRQDVPRSFVHRLYDTRLVREFNIERASLPKPTDSSTNTGG